MTASAEGWPDRGDFPYRLLIRIRTISHGDAVVASLISSRVGAVVPLDAATNLTAVARKATLASRDLHADRPLPDPGSYLSGVEAFIDWDDICPPFWPWPRPPWWPWPGPRPDEFVGDPGPWSWLAGQDPAGVVIIDQALQLLKASSSEELQNALVPEVTGLLGS
jgi:hypothetical protein